MTSVKRPYTPTSVARTLTHIPLWIALILPFIVIITVIVGLTNYLAYENSQNAVNDVVNELLIETNSRIQNQLTTFMAIPEHINRSNVHLIETDILASDNPDLIAQHFHREVQLYDTVTSIYFGNAEGGLALGGREGADGSLYIIYTENFASGELYKYATDTDGNLTDLLVTVPEFDARIRPWYTGAVESGDIHWTSPYALSTGQDMAIASSQPVYDEAGELIGVVSVDIFLSHIRDFLGRLEIGTVGQIFIMDPSGFLVATSTDAMTFIRMDGGYIERISALDSDNYIIAESARLIIDEFDGLSSEIQQQTSIMIDGKPHYLLVSPFHTESGLDWLIVISIPQADFLESIFTQNLVTVSLTLIALATAIIVGTALTFLIVRPISHLSDAVSNIGDGLHLEPVPTNGIHEIRILTSAFNKMSEQLKEAFSTLEERIADRTAELSVSEARFRGVVEDQTELIARFSSDYGITFCNKAYERYFGKMDAAMVDFNFLELIPEDDHALVQGELARISAEVPIVTIEHRVIRSDGKIRWMQWINRGIFTDDGELAELQAVGRDITERKQFEARLQQALDREIELSQLKSQFISTVSHEFRTPLTIIMNSSEILQRYSNRLDDEGKEKHYKKIQRQVLHMTDLLSDVLTISRNNTGVVDLTLEPVDLKRLTESIIEEIRESQQGEMNINLSATGECDALMLDTRAMRLILTNLIGNATKYSDPDSAIAVRLSCDDDTIIMEVEDHGIGIPEVEQVSVFEPFFRSENAENIQGTGLGLAIVKRSVLQHGGTITLVSQENEGTTFTVSIPKHRD